MATTQFIYQSATTNRGVSTNHRRVLHYNSLIRSLAFTVIIFFTTLTKGDAARPSGVSACISYNAPGFAHLNLQWKTSGISDPVIVQIYYTVNKEDQPALNMPYPQSKSFTDILLSDVTYNDNISVEFLVRNITTFSERSDPLTIRANPLYKVKWFFLPQSHLTFVCTLACRTSIIRGCEVSLSQEHETISKQSDNIMGTLNETSGHDINVIFSEVNMSDISPISYSARAIAQNSSNMFEFGQQIDGIISRDSNSMSTISSTVSSTIITSNAAVEPSNLVIAITSSSMATTTATPSVTTISNSVTTISNTVANTATPKVSSPESNESSDNMVSIIIGIVVAVVVVAFVIIAVLLVIVVCKLQGNRRNSKDSLRQKSFKINKSTIPATVRERMVSIKSEASNRPDSNTYEQTDIDDQPPKLFKTLEPCLYPHYETQELAVNGVSTAHTSCYSCTDIIAHPPSNYNRLVYSRSEDDSIVPPLLSVKNYNQLNIEAHNYDEVSIDDLMDNDMEGRSQDYVNVVCDDHESSS